ncbi:MAG: hypothetical protein Q9186_006107 [Xanthomendoza sp. 1 TL-2023]
MKIPLLLAAALSIEVTFAIPFGGLVPSKGKLLLPRVKGQHSSGHRSSKNTRPHEIPSHRDANQRSRQGYRDGSGRYHYESPAWYKESQAEMTDAFGRMNIEKNFWNEPDTRHPNPGESKRTIMVENGVQIHDTTFGDKTGQHGRDLFVEQTFFPRSSETLWRPNNGPSRRPESLGGLPTDGQLYGKRPNGAPSMDRDEKYANGQAEPNTNADTWVGKPPYMVMGVPHQESLFIDSPALRGSKDWVNANPGSQMRFRSNLSQKEKDRVWAERDKIQVYRGPYEPGLFPNPPIHEIKPAWDSGYLHPFPDRRQSAPPNRKQDKYLSDKYIDPNAPRHRSSSPSARSYGDMVVRDKKKDRSRRDKHRLSESSSAQPPRRPPPRQYDSDYDADIVEIRPGGRYKRDAVDMAADKQTNAESTKPDVDMDEFKVEYQGAMDYFSELQNNATDIIMPIIEDMVAGSNSDDIYGMAWEIISLIEPRIVFPPSGLFYQGTHACDWYEKQLANQTDATTMKEISDVHTVLIDIYMDGWERATNALNEGGLLENLYNVTNTLALNSNQSTVADLKLPDTGFKELMEFMDGLDDSPLTDIPAELLNGTSSDSKSTYKSGDGTFIIDNFSSTDGKETPTDGKETPTDGKETPTDGKKTPTDGKETSTDGKETSTDGKETSTDGKETSTDGKETPTDGKQTSTDRKETSTDGKETSTDGKETATDGKETSADGKETSTDGAALPTTDGAKSGDSPASADDETSKDNTTPPATGENDPTGETPSTESNAKGETSASDTENTTPSSDDSNKTPTSDSSDNRDSSSSTTTTADATQQEDQTKGESKGETKEGTEGESKEGEHKEGESKEGQPTPGEPTPGEPTAGEPTKKETNPNPEPQAAEGDKNSQAPNDSTATDKTG